jgi:putative ABC transport system permease protein
MPFALSTNYLKTIFRNFRRNKSYTILNLAGLALGFAVFLFSTIYVDFETSYESFHSRADRIYRATYRYTPSEGYGSHWARIPFDYINQLPEDVSGVESLIRFQNHARKYVRVGNEKFRPNHAYVTDKEVFSVFDFRLSAGNPSTALAEPHSIVITRALAREYFGNSDPMGKEIFVIGDLDKEETLHHITGVMEDLPANTHLPVEMLISFRDPAERSGWAYTYVLLEDQREISSVADKMPAFIRKYSSEDEAKNDAIIFQPLTDIHLHSNLAREIVPGSRMFYVQMVRVAGLLILIVAVINFMNLNSAMSLGRAKEIGMRKILGARRPDVISYLMTEAVISNLVAMVIAMLLAYLSFPWFHDLVNVSFVGSATVFAATMLGVSVISGIASGIYPVVLLTGIPAAEVVKTSRVLSFGGREGAFSLKRVMVTLQFCISIVLLGSALIAYQQLRFLSETNLGITREQVIAIPGLPDNVKSEFLQFKTMLSLQPGIAGVSGCMEVPSREIRDFGPVLVEGVNSDAAKAPNMDIQPIDPDFVALMGLELQAGTNLSPVGVATMPALSDEFNIQAYLLEQPREYLINETAMRRLGWESPDEAIGQRISWSIGELALAPGPVRGVVRDFHQETLKNRVDPVVLVYEPVWLRTFLVKVETQNVQKAVQSIESTWEKLFPLYPLEYHFLDDLYESLYNGERVQLKLLFVFSALAIVIAFIGLIGLTAYSLKTRMKELAVRMVLGATMRDLTKLMSREYFAVLLIGGILAVPISLYGISQWLDGFAYHVGISPWIYAVTILAVMALLFATVGLQTLRTSRANPAQTLREE